MWGIFRYYLSQSGTIFHNTEDAALGLPAKGVDVHNFEYPDYSIFKDLSLCESQVLTMMNAIDFHNTPLIKKKHRYYEYIIYWYGIFKKLKPDCLLFPDIPHLPHNYVAYQLGKLLGIKIVMYAELKRLPDRLIFTTDHRTYPEIYTLYEQEKKKEYSINDLPEELREYVKKQTNPDIDSTPAPIRQGFLRQRGKISRILPDVYGVINSLKKRSVLKNSKNYIKQLFRQIKIVSLEGFSGPEYRVRWFLRQGRKARKKLEEEYRNLESKPNFKDKYIYVPLHEQPERTTSAEGGIYVDQILMIKTLSKSIPHDWKIYVKEHKPQWIMYRGHIGRYQGYYKQLEEIKNVKLLPVETSTYDLLKHAQTVATVTGTASWEAIFREKPSLVFGYPWFLGCEGVFSVKSVSDCKKVIRKITEGYKPDFKKVISFFMVLDKVSTIAHDHHKFNKYRDIPDEENAQNIANGYLKLLKQS